MLVLSRKENQSIMVGENIEILVVKVNGNNVRIGIKAPTDVRIIRSELMGTPAGEPKSDPAAVEDATHVES